MINDILYRENGDYPDHKIIAIVDHVVAIERMDGVLEPITWYSDRYINQMLDKDWKLKRL